MRLHLPLALALAWSLACASGSSEAPSTHAATEGAPTAGAPEAAPAVEPEFPLEVGYMVIVAGDADPVAAKKKLEDYVERGVSANGYPKLLDSSEVDGLKPGFHIVVAAVPDTKAIGEHMAELLAKTFPGTYVREVRVPEVESFDCAFPGADRRCYPEAWRAIVVFDRSDGDTSEDWAFFTDDVLRIANEAGIQADWLGQEDYVEVQVDGERVGGVNMGPYLKDHELGYVFAMEGQMPVYQEHAMVDEVIDAAEAYFDRALR